MKTQELRQSFSEDEKAGRLGWVGAGVAKGLRK